MPNEQYTPLCRFCRWQALRPRDGPGGNPAVVLAQLEGVWAQLQEMQEAAARHAQVGVQGVTTVQWHVGARAKLTGLLAGPQHRQLVPAPILPILFPPA